MGDIFEHENEVCEAVDTDFNGYCAGTEGEEESIVAAILTLAAAVRSVAAVVADKNGTVTFDDTLGHEIAMGIRHAYSVSGDSALQVSVSGPLEVEHI